MPGKLTAGLAGTVRNTEHHCLKLRVGFQHLLCDALNGDDALVFTIIHDKEIALAQASPAFAHRASGRLSSC